MKGNKKMEKNTLLEKAIQMVKDTGYVDVIKMANDEGIGVFAVDKDDSFNAQIVYDKESKKYNLYVNENHTLGRQRFSVAHELAHRVLHNAELMTLGKLDRDGDSVMEQQADDLAAEILMPETVVQNYMSSQGIEVDKIEKKDILDIAEKFKVSKSVAIIRLRELDYYVPFIQFS